MALTNVTVPTLYEYYTGNGISAGLSDNQSYFTLNDKNITIYSGSLHYFRVPRAYWRDRLRKMRAAGLNTVATYIPWNLHEPHSGVYDFGDGGSEWEDFLHVEEFLKTAQEEDLLTLIRTGPYINSEWEMGGLPSWILRNVTSVRNSNDTLLQFQKGGPIVGFQIENEFGNTGRHDLPYLEVLRQMFLDNGITELLYTSDRPKMNGIGAIPGVLQTANFASEATEQLDKLNTLQTNKPTMTMEYWTGWWDHWLDDKHHTVAPSKFEKVLVDILDYPSSVNMYIFVGGTSFGFLNGATLYTKNNSGLQPIINSYDYDAPLTEYGAYTEKYNMTKELIAARNNIITKIPETPEIKPLVTYNDLQANGQLLLSEVIDDFKDKIESANILPMEKLPINNNSGQSFGYIAYRKTNLVISAGAVLNISGYVSDTVLVLLNGKLVSQSPKNSSDTEGFGFWKLLDSTLVLTSEHLNSATLDLVVENFGRSSQGAVQFKGLTGDVYINNEKINNWEISPLEFKRSWTNSLTGWHSMVSKTQTSALYKFTLNLEAEPEDTYIDMREWNKGLTIVNGFVLSRHFFVGPQQTEYLPAPFLKHGKNTIIVFEHYNAADYLKFSNKPIFEVRS